MHFIVTISNRLIKVAIKIASKILKCKERNCAFENLSLRCGATKKKLVDLRSSAQYAQLCIQIIFLILNTLTGCSMRIQICSMRIQNTPGVTSA
jgi:hypothetical protein